MMYNIRSGAIRWQIHDFLSDGNSNVCQYLTKCPDEKFDLENLGQDH